MRIGRRPARRGAALGPPRRRVSNDVLKPIDDLIAETEKDPKCFNTEDQKNDVPPVYRIYLASISELKSGAMHASPVFAEPMQLSPSFVASQFLGLSSASEIPVS
jgi:hypothetical protein